MVSEIKNPEECLRGNSSTESLISSDHQAHSVAVMTPECRGVITLSKSHRSEWKKEEVEEEATFRRRLTGRLKNI